MLTRTTRRLVFYGLILIFFALGTGVVFYVQGYRLDPKTLGLSRIGAIYIRTYPTDTTITVDDESIERPFRLFENGVLINDLFPKTYTLRAERSGFAPWQQTVQVEPSRVAQFEHAVLVPIDAVRMNETSTHNFWLIAGEPLLKTTDGTLLWRGRAVSGTTALGWTTDGNRLLTRNERTNAYAWINLETGEPVPLLSLLRSSGLSNPALMVDSENSSHLIARTGRTIAIIDFQTDRMETLATTTTALPFLDHVASSRSLMAWGTFSSKTNTSTIVVYNKTGGTVERRLPTLNGKTIQLTWSRNNILGILQDTNTLYLYDPAAQTLRAQANDVVGFSFSDDGRMLVARERRSIEAFSLEDDGYSRLNLPEVERITDIAWYTDNRHLVVSYPERVSFVSLDDRSLENIRTIADVAISGYDPENNTFYFIESNFLFRLDFPR